MVQNRLSQGSTYHIIMSTFSRQWTIKHVALTVSLLVNGGFLIYRLEIMHLIFGTIKELLALSHPNSNPSNCSTPSDTYTNSAKSLSTHLCKIFANSTNHFLQVADL